MKAAVDVDDLPHVPTRPHFSHDDWKMLVAVTTCNRASLLRRLLPRLAAAVGNDSRIALFVAVDGNDEEVLAFCERWQVPSLHGSNRVGVGITKNRVLDAYPNFDYYCFLDDDVELRDGRVFERLVALSRATSIPTFTLGHPSWIKSIRGETTAIGERIKHCDYGPGAFNFFSAPALFQVGGWHPRFAQYRRFGHTEHSQRFVNAGLAPSAFNVVTTLTDACAWLMPPSVARPAEVEFDVHEIAEPERELMQTALTGYPIVPFAPYLISGPEPRRLTELERIAAVKNRYPLVHGRERRQASADFLATRMDRDPRPRYAAAAGLLSLALDPGSLMLRHLLKLKLAHRSRWRDDS